MNTTHDQLALRALLTGNRKQLKAIRKAALAAIGACCPQCDSANVITNCQGNYSQCLDCAADWDHAEVAL